VDVPSAYCHVIYPAYSVGASRPCISPRVAMHVALDNGMLNATPAPEGTSSIPTCAPRIEGAVNEHPDEA
jgi:hypothetical protein